MLKYHMLSFFRKKMDMESFFLVLVSTIDTFIWTSSPEMFCKKDVLRNFTKFTGKHLCQSLFFKKVAGPATLLKKRLWHRCFPVNFAKFLGTPFLIKHLRRLILLFEARWFLGGCRLVKIRLYSFNKKWCSIKRLETFSQSQTNLKKHIWIAASILKKKKKHSQFPPYAPMDSGRIFVSL